MQGGLFKQPEWVDDPKNDPAKTYEPGTFKGPGISPVHSTLTEIPIPNSDPSPQE